MESDKYVNVRELHPYLGSKRKFTNWFEYQVENCNLIEGKDYSELTTKNVINSGIKRGRGRPAKEFSHDSSREISQITQERAKGY